MLFNTETSTFSPIDLKLSDRISRTVNPRLSSYGRDDYDEYEYMRQEMRMRSIREKVQSILVKKDTICVYAKDSNDIFKVQKQPASSNNAAQIEIT